MTTATVKLLRSIETLGRFTRGPSLKQLTGGGPGSIAQLLTEAPLHQRETAQAVDHHLRQLLEHPTAWVRAATVRQYGRHHPELALAPEDLDRLAADPSVYVRQAVADHPAVTDRQLTLLAADPAAYVRASVRHAAARRDLPDDARRQLDVIASLAPSWGGTREELCTTAATLAAG